MDAFFDQTPRTFLIYTNAVHKEKERDFREKVTIAYMSAIWSREGVKVPKLKDVLGERPEKPKEVTPEQFWELFRENV